MPKLMIIPGIEKINDEIEAGRVTLKATDLENAIQTTTPAKVSGVGAVAAPTKRLQDILNASPEDEISISEQDGHWLKIVAGRANYRLACMSPDSFPTMPSLPPMLFDIPAAQLLAMAERVGFAISTEESRFTLNAALFETGPAGGQMVSTDGHRLAIHAVNGFSAPESKLLVPKKALAELVKICKDAEEDSRVQIAKDDSHLFFTCGERLLICRQLSGQFQDYKAVIPKGNDVTVTADRAALVSVIKRVALLSDERSCAIKLTLKPSTLHMEASGNDAGQKILEPSAGTGVICKAVDMLYLTGMVNLTAVEINAKLAGMLETKASQVVNADFLECNGNLGQFDRILMNPPFSKGQDIKHIEHALTFLKPDGRLVAICANGPRQQERLKPLADIWEDLPAGTFKEAGTNVNTALMVVNR